MTSQRVVLGDCLDVFANERNVPAFVQDPPGLVGYSGFMGRKWDTAHEKSGGFVPMLPTRSKEHASELEKDYDFTRYWAIRYAMAYDIAAQHATMVLWTLPRTSHLTANALRAAGWRIKDNLVHLFGTGWAKSGNALAPGQEGWLLATKGKPELDIDACRVPRGGGVYGSGDQAGKGNIANQTGNGRTRGGGVGIVAESHPLGSLPKNALLSHCEECVRLGSKRVKGEKPRELHENGTMGYGGGKAFVGRTVGGNADGTESVPAWHCLAGCVCGARSKWDPEKPLPRCPCGEVWRWLCAVAEVNAQSGERPGMSGGGKHSAGYTGGLFGGIDCESTLYADQGGSARFFNTFSYLAKCSPSERHAGCENLFWRANKKNPFGFDQVTKEEWEGLPGDQRAQGNTHPTCKSYRLMHWLHSLTGAKRILDMTAGSGTGMYTAYLDGIDWLGAEICPEAIAIGEARLAFWKGLSHSAREAFMQDDAMPEKAIIQGSQLSLL